MDKLTLLLLVIPVWLQYSLWFGKNDIRDYTRVNNGVVVQQVTGAKLKAQNDQLLVEIDDLSGGQEALEEHACNELNMTRPGETFYRLVPDASKCAQSVRQNNQQISLGINMAITHLDVCAVVPATGFGRRVQTECPK